MEKFFVSTSGHIGYLGCSKWTETHNCFSQEQIYDTISIASPRYLS